MAHEPALTVNLAHGLQAGFLSEAVVLAFVVVTVEQARRPVPEIVVVAVVLRASYHIYYGPGVLGVLVWAPTFVWLYRRFRTIVPLIVVHSAWDLLAVLSARWRGVAVVDGLLVLALLVTAPITWLVDRADRHRAPAGSWGPPRLPARGTRRRRGHGRRCRRPAGTRTRPARPGGGGGRGPSGGGNRRHAPTAGPGTRDPTP